MTTKNLAINFAVNLKIKLAVLIFAAFGFFNPSSPFSDTSIEKIWVGKADGTVQCQKIMGVSLTKMKKQLESAKIKVLSQKKRSDGKMRIQVCGSPSGMLNTFEISASDLELARKIGFFSL